jgi:lipoprotein Spr
VSGPKTDEAVTVNVEPSKTAQPVLPAPEKTDIESASPVQLKYAVLMKTEVEYLPSKTLLQAVDEYFGVRYRTGGNTRSGIDCSGFTCAVYAAAYGFALPRVSKEQYRLSRKVSTAELQEGDLLFFNTRGSGVSHVGVYLGNNKFIHATVHGGVMVNDLFEKYYLQRYLGAGRYDDKQLVSSN